MSERSPDVVVIGGGAIGCATAWELERRGLRVTVVERGTPGQEATWAAAGMLSPLGEASEDEAFLRLAVAGLDRYPRFAAALLAATGIEIEYRTNGKLHIALDADDDAVLNALLARGEAFGAERLSAPEARSREPALTDRLREAVFVRRDCSVNNRRLAAAVWSAAVGAGVEFRLGAEAKQIRTAREPGLRVTQVVLTSGESIATGHVVLCAGAWSGQIDGLPGPLPVHPVRGQMFAIKSNVLPGAFTAMGMLIEHVIMTADCYIIPRESGHIVVGATVEDVAFTPGPTPHGIGMLLAAAMRAIPAIGDLPLIETWAGFRPGTPDDLPILGTDPEVEGLHYATGHYRNGILLTPITAEAIADVITGSPPAVPLDRFGIARFRESRERSTE